MIKLLLKVYVGGEDLCLPPIPKCRKNNISISDFMFFLITSAYLFCFCLAYKITLLFSKPRLQFVRLVIYSSTHLNVAQIVIFHSRAVARHCIMGGGLFFLYIVLQSVSFKRYFVCFYFQCTRSIHLSSTAYTLGRLYTDGYTFFEHPVPDDQFVFCSPEYCFQSIV